MNKYIVPICDVENGIIKLNKYVGRSEKDIEEKIMNKYRDSYDFSDYDELLDILYDSNTIIGDITDVETL